MNLNLLDFGLLVKVIICCFIESRSIVTLDARLGYRNRGDEDSDWKYYASSVEERILDCSIDNVSNIISYTY